MRRLARLVALATLLWGCEPDCEQAGDAVVSGRAHHPAKTFYVQVGNMMLPSTTPEKWTVTLFWKRTGCYATY